MFAINSTKLLWARVHPGVRLCNTTPPGAAPRAALGVWVGGPFHRDSFLWKRCSCCKSRVRRLCPPLRRGHMPLCHDTQPAAFPYVLFHPSPAFFPPLLAFQQIWVAARTDRERPYVDAVLISNLLEKKKKKRIRAGLVRKSRYITQKIDAPHGCLCTPDICFQRVAIKSFFGFGVPSHLSHVPFIMLMQMI